VPYRPRSAVVTVDATPTASKHEPPAGALEEFLARNAPEVVGVTYTFEPPREEPLESVTLRVTGKRLDVEGVPGPRDAFVHDETWSGIVPGSGPLAVTTKIRDVPAGRWKVDAQAVAEAPTPAGQRASRHPIPVHRAAWSWRRWRVEPSSAEPVTTRPAPLVRTPAVVLGSWMALVITGIVLAILTQSFILASQSVRLTHSLTISLLSVLAGAVGAKVWYIVLHRRDGQRNGWAIQGLVTGIAVAAAVLLWALSVAPGPYLDATAPALLFGMAVGRVGCFLTGCCAGRPTPSRWGIWSSNRTVGARRIPVQLLESLLAAIVGGITLLVVLATGPRHGLVFIAAVASYTLIRQWLLLFREEKRQSRRGAPLIAGVSAIVLVSSVVIGLLT
jgi:phosphatidylglycerol:prolipoprotein diacylglycerol transferase